MGHSKNRGRRGLILPFQPRAKLIGLSILIAGFASLIASAQLDPIMAQVERVIDGDSIRVRFEGKSYAVRLMGVDTPETKHPTKTVEYFGREASAFTKAALEGQTVLLAKDRTGDTVDRYGRLLRYVPPGRRQLQRPAHPRGLRPCLPALSLLETPGVHSARRTSEAARNRLMEPPLRSRGCGLGHLRQLTRVARSPSAPNRCNPLIENCRARRNGDMPSGGAPTRFRADRRTGPGCAMFSRFPSPGPVWPDAIPAPERSARLRRLSLGLAFVGPARHRRGRRFPSASGFGRFPPFAGERKTLTNP